MNTNNKDIVTVFLLNILLHHVDMPWIIETYEKLKCDMEKHNPYCITGSTWYNTYICKILHGTVFTEFIINEITYSYNFMFSIDTHEKQQPPSFYCGRSGGVNALQSNSKT